MVEVQLANGTSFCIDSTEVTQAQYAQFLASVKATPGSEHPECKDNKKYAPDIDYAPQPPGELIGCAPPEYYTPATTPNKPVVCVDWCDAQAFCKWAGKRLCGRIGGGANTTDQEWEDATKSQWFHACAMNGANAYPYGAAYNAVTCEGRDYHGGGAGLPKWSTKLDVKSLLGCRGAAAPFSGIYDLSGGVSEWTDECMFWKPSGDWDCALRGGDYGSVAGEMACTVSYSSSRLYDSVTFGFRCCS